MIDLQKLEDSFNNITQEDIEKYFPSDTRPKGWLSIEQHLPMMYAIDINKGFTVVKVKDKDGNVFESSVSDHNIWYYVAKESGITHWWNGDDEEYFLYQIETRRKMFHWFIDGWGYHITLNMFPNHGITWDMYDRLTPEFVTEHYNVNLLS